MVKTNFPSLSFSAKQQLAMGGSDDELIAQKAIRAYIEGVQ